VRDSIQLDVAGTFQECCAKKRCTIATLQQLQKRYRERGAKINFRRRTKFTRKLELPNNLGSLADDDYFKPVPGIDIRLCHPLIPLKVCSE
jgi:hypothetical protein